MWDVQITETWLASSRLRLTLGTSIGIVGGGDGSTLHFLLMEVIIGVISCITVIVILDETNMIMIFIPYKRTWILGKTWVTWIFVVRVVSIVSERSHLLLLFFFC